MYKRNLTSFILPLLLALVMLTGCVRRPHHSHSRSRQHRSEERTETRTSTSRDEDSEGRTSSRGRSRSSSRRTNPETSRTRTATSEDIQSSYGAPYMSEDEKMVLFYTNEARQDGKAFWEKYNDRIKGSDYYVQSLKEELFKTKDLPMLSPDEELYKSAEYHALDMGRTGQLGHDSSDGTSFGDRMHKMFSGNYAGENCSYGTEDPLDMVIALLVDEGIPDFGHRKNILNPKFNRVGIAIRDHRTYRINLVQDFGRK